MTCIYSSKSYAVSTATYSPLFRALRYNLVKLVQTHSNKQLIPNQLTIRNTINLLMSLSPAITSNLDFEDISVEANGSISIDIFKDDIALYFSVGEASFNYYIEKGQQPIADEENLYFSHHGFYDKLIFISYPFEQLYNENIRTYYSFAKKLAKKQIEGDWGHCINKNIYEPA